MSSSEIIHGDCRVLRIALPPGLPLLNANDRRSHYQRAKLTREIKAEVVKLVKNEEPFTGKVRIRATYSPGTRHRHDPGNLYPSVKAAVDALVPQKSRKVKGKMVEPPPFVPLLADDSSEYVSEVSLVIAEQIVPKGQLVIQVISDE
jgi:hypothetical protein